MSADKNVPSLAHIGERIRAVRLRRGMTQNELAGGDVTRNMLSRIENGAALPSLPTLCAIASRLDVPAGALLDGLEGYASHRIEDDMRELIKKQKYSKAIEYYDSSEHGCDCDGIASALSDACIERAWELYREGRLTDALALLSRADDAHGESERSYILRTLINSCPAITCGDTSDEPSEHLREIIFDRSDTAVYLYCQKKLGDIAAMPYSQPHESAEPLRRDITPLIDGLSDGLYKTHIYAKLDMVSADYLSAKAKLLTLLAPDVPPALLWALYTDIEFCCKCCGDFENAYKYSGLKLELIKRIN